MVQENNKDLIFPESVQTSSKPGGKNKVLLMLLFACCVLAVGGISVYFWMQTSQTGIAPEPKTRQAELDALYASEALPQTPEGVDPFNYGLEAASSTSFEGVRGHIVFSGTPVGSNGLTRVYTLDVSTDDAEPQLLLPDTYKVNGFAEFLNRNEESDVFINTIDEVISATSTDRDGTRIQRYNIETGELESFESLSGMYEQNIAYSPNNDLVAFKRLNVPFRSYTDLVPLRNWVVAVSSIATDEVIKVLATAGQPKWSPDGSMLLVLKPDGLYTYDVASGIELRVINIGTGEILATSMMDVSPDGKYLAWTTAKAGVIALNEIVSWNPFTIREIGRIHEDETEYYWPQFSPDSQYYAVQAIDAAEEGSVERKNPRFEIRAVNSRDVVRSISIDAFDFNSFFTDTWVAKVPNLRGETTTNQ